MYHGDEHSGTESAAPDPRDADALADRRIAGDPGRRRPAEAVIDLSAIAHNTRLLREHSNSHLMAVVKGDGFGHGAVEVARTTLANGATWLGVAHISEALALRAAGLTAPILAWMHPSDDDVTDALREDIDLSASSLAHLTGIAACADGMGILAAVHLKVDTGLHRNGSSFAEWPALIRAAVRFEEQGLVRIRGIWSHLAFSDDPTHPTTGRQIELFDTAVRQAEEAGLKADLLHLANSSAALTVPRTRYDMVRAGVVLYGVEPVPGQTFGLRPAMTLRATVIATQDVPAGEDVAFDHPHPATDHPTRMALLPLGYMSGLPRAASEAARVWLGGVRRPIAGLIDMDQCVVDAGSGEIAAEASVAIGDDAVFFGSGEQGEPTAAEWAAWANTNAQQVLTGLGIRVPRRYLPDSTPRPHAAPAQHKPRVTILFGGPGSEDEYEASCASAASIATHLDRNHYVVRPVRVTRDGNWIPGPANLPEGQYNSRDLLRLTSTRGITHQPTDILRTADVVIPALHNPFVGTSPGTLQALMDTLNVPYIGSGMAASALATDKDAAKRVAETTGIPVAEWAVLRHEKEDLSDEDRTRLGLPVLVKPARSAPGEGTTRVTDWNDLEAALTAARAWDNQVVVEQEIAGQEIDVAALEHPDGRLEAHSGTADLQRLAVEIFNALGCSGLAQISFLLRGGTEPVFNEINPLPVFAPASAYPQAWQTAGVPLSDLLDQLIETALAKTD